MTIDLRSKKPQDDYVFLTRSDGGSLFYWGDEPVKGESVIVDHSKHLPSLPSKESRYTVVQSSRLDPDMPGRPFWLARLEIA